MKFRFFADQMNDRRVWSWVDGQHVTDDAAEIENLIGIGFRHEEVSEVEPVAEPKKRGREKRAK